MAKNNGARIDLPGKTRKAACAPLNELLAGGIDLRGQILAAHWNVRGPHFIALHELFEDLAEEFEEPIDDLAERITALGGVAEGTTRLAAKASKLPELPLESRDGLKFVELLADRVAAFGKAVRAGIEATTKLDDAGTADLLTGLSRALDKALWKLESHLE